MIDSNVTERIVIERNLIKCNLIERIVIDSDTIQRRREAVVEKGMW